MAVFHLGSLLRPLSGNLNRSVCNVRRCLVKSKVTIAAATCQSRTFAVPSRYFHQTPSILVKNSSVVPESTQASQKKRIQRKRRPVMEQEDGGIPQWEVHAYSTAEDYDLEKLILGLQQQGLYHPSSMSEDIHDVLHVSARYQVDREPREIYLFREGSVVFWNVSELERQNVLSFLKPYESGSYDQKIIKEENENMTYTYTEVFNKTRLMNGRILLNAEGSLDLEKYAFSNALAQSVKLAIWEASLDRYVDSVEFVVDDLKKGGLIKLSESDVLKKQGELFSLRHLINLSSDLLDTPDFYWDRENLETLYHKTCNHLNISKRTRVMKEKLNECCELVELLSGKLMDAHHTRLEMLIIALITIEVVFAAIHMYGR